MRIAVVGSGYVGLVSGACFAELGSEVICVDTDAEKIDSLSQGISPIYEPGLESLLQKNLQAGRLRFTTGLTESVARADIVFIAVGTPPRAGDGQADLSHVFVAAEAIGKALEGDTLIVTKSTVPVGTGRKIAEILRKANSSASWHIASNPEFLREGSAIRDFMQPDRVVAGTDSDHAREMLAALYRPLAEQSVPIVFTGIETAELIKYASNAFLGTKVAFINEMADLAEELGADIGEVAYAIGLDRRIGSKFLNAGPGFGGSCFPKDALALTYIARQTGTPMRIVETVIASNEARKLQMADKIASAFKGDLKGKKLAILGLTFKPNTDDMRESPSLVILPRLMEMGARLCAYDPQGMKEAKKIFNDDIEWRNDAYGTMEGADAAVILTEWDAFRTLDLARAQTLLKSPLIIDLRNIFSPEDMRRAGLRYISIGRPPIELNARST